MNGAKELFAPGPLAWLIVERPPIIKVFPGSHTRNSVHVQHLLNTGLRRSDIEAINIGDIQFDRNIIATQNRKAKKIMPERPIPEPVMTELSNYVATIPEGQLPDRVMLGVYNYNGEQAEDVTLKVDLDSLNLIPQLPWQEFIGVRDLWTADGAARPATFEFHNAALSLKTLQPHTLHLIGVRRY